MKRKERGKVAKVCGEVGAVQEGGNDMAGENVEGKVAKRVGKGHKRGREASDRLTGWLVLTEPFWLASSRLIWTGQRGTTWREGRSKTGQRAKGTVGEVIGNGKCGEENGQNGREGKRSERGGRSARNSYG